MVAVVSLEDGFPGGWYLVVSGHPAGWCYLRFLMDGLPGSLWFFGFVRDGTSGSWLETCFARTTGPAFETLLTLRSVRRSYYHCISDLLSEHIILIQNLFLFPFPFRFLYFLGPHGFPRFLHRRIVRLIFRCPLLKMRNELLR